MIFDITWALAIWSILGTMFNVKKKSVCFYIWASGEMFWIIIDLSNHQYGRVFLDSVHFAMAIWGILSWNKEKKLDGNK